MTGAGGVFTGHPSIAAVSHQRRALILTVVVALHAFALTLLLGSAPVVNAPDEERSLITFDVTSAPPPPPVRSPPPRLPPEPVRRAAEPAGGSSPARPAPTARARDIAPASSFEATINPDAAPLAPPLPDLGGGLAGLDLDGAGGTGEGAGAGSGTGPGDGTGRLRWARAQWIEQPPRRLIDDHWPERAKANSISGAVLLACVMPRPGRPERCEVIMEHPAGEEFGAAALRMSAVFRIRPVRRNGRVQHDIHVIVPVIFRHPRERPAP